MSGILKNGLAVIFIGLVIKLMDDYLDQEIDRLNERDSLAVKLNRGILPYSLLLFSGAVLCNYKLAISLLWASYIVGMGINKKDSSFYFADYYELPLLLLIGFLCLDKGQFLFSLLIILSIQAGDDYIDYYQEKYINRDNFVNYLGKMGTIMITFFSLAASLYLNMQLSLLIVSSSILINFIL